MAPYKQAILVRDDIEMSEGKKIAQACHASLGAYKKADTDAITAWEERGQKKVVLQVGSQEELLQTFEEAKTDGFPAYLVTDAGKTEIDAGTKTSAAIGPGRESDMDRLIGHLTPL